MDNHEASELLHRSGVEICMTDRRSALEIVQALGLVPVVNSIKVEQVSTV